MSAASASVKPAKTAKPKSALPGWLVRWQQQAWWPWAKRIVVGGFLLFVVTLLVIQARSIEWDEVFSTMGRTRSACSRSLRRWVRPAT